MIINLCGKKIELTDWQKVTSVSNQRDAYKSWARRPIINDVESPYLSGIVLRVSYGVDIEFPNYYWTPQFCGWKDNNDIKHLEAIYNSFYDPPPTYYDYEIDSAKAHMDGFIAKFNKLAVFL